MVVVSAMGDTTDELIELAEQIVPVPGGREFDMLLTAGERISMALLAMAINSLGYTRAVIHGLAGRRAHHVRPRQGAHRQHHARTGRGIAGRGQRRNRRGIPGLLEGDHGHHDARPRRIRHHGGGARRRASAHVCEIYTDVDGVYTADPRIVPNARRAGPSHLRGDARDWPRAGQRSCTCGQSSTGAAMACRCTSARRSRPNRARSSPDRSRSKQWSRRSSPASPTTAARPR